jgi:hypothetical protein
MLEIGRQDDVLAHQRAMNNSRYVPTMPDIVRRVSEENRIYVFNVGPWRHVREMGSAGNWAIPACPDGKEYSEPVVIDGVMSEPYPMSEVAMSMLPLAAKARQLAGDGEGWDFALQVLGEGPHIPRNASFKPFGVFLSKSNPPQKQEVADARRLLNQKYLELVRSASEAWALGPARAGEVIQASFHHVAARALRKTEAECPWLANTEQLAERADCPSCGAVYSKGIMKCRGCGFILDKARYDKAVKDGLFAA